VALGYLPLSLPLGCNRFCGLGGDAMIVCSYDVWKKWFRDWHGFDASITLEQFESAVRRPPIRHNTDQLSEREGVFDIENEQRDGWAYNPTEHEPV
jgi:hypothetical protein